MNLKIYIISALFLCLMAQAQNYTWQWGQYGGGDQGSFGSVTRPKKSLQI